MIEVKQEEDYVFLKLPNGTTLAIKEEYEGIVLDFWEDMKEDNEPIQSTYYFYHEIGKDRDE